MKYARVVALIAVLALAVTAFVGVSSAAAFTQFRSEAAETTLDGEMVEGTANPAVFTTDAGAISCTSGTAMATMTGTSATAIETSLPGSTGSGISYGGCTFLGFIGVKVEMNKCQYNFHINGEVDITPSPSSTCGTPEPPIKFTALSCTVSVASQPGLKSVTYENMGTKAARDVTIIPNLTGITYSTSAGCPNGAHTGLTDGTYKGGKFTVKGTHPAGTQVGVWVE
jgi:hypothetical protein